MEVTVHKIQNPLELKKYKEELEQCVGNRWADWARWLDAKMKLVLPVEVYSNYRSKNPERVAAAQKWADDHGIEIIHEDLRTGICKNGEVLYAYQVELVCTA